MSASHSGDHKNFGGTDSPGTVAAPFLADDSNSWGRRCLRFHIIASDDRWGAGVLGVPVTNRVIPLNCSIIVGYGIYFLGQRGLLSVVRGQSASGKERRLGGWNKGSPFRVTAFPRTMDGSLNFGLVQQQ